MNYANPVGAYLAGQQGVEQNRLLKMQQQGAQQAQAQGAQKHQSDMQGQQMQQLLDIGRAVAWAETPEQWNQVVDFYEQNGMPEAGKYRDRFDMRPALAGQLAQNIPAGLQEHQALVAAARSSDPLESNAARVKLGLDPRASSAGAKVIKMTGPDGRERAFVQQADGSLVPAGDQLRGETSTPDPFTSRPEEESAGAITAAQEQARLEAERARNEPKRQEKARQQIAAIDNTFAAIDRAMGDVGVTTAGPIGSLMQNIPGTSARDLRETITTIKANIGFDRLQMMRDASPTGGALGQVAIQELAALQASIASLDQAQTPTQLRENLTAVRRHYESWKEAVTKSAGGETQSDGWSIERID